MTRLTNQFVPGKVYCGSPAGNRLTLNESCEYAFLHEFNTECLMYRANIISDYESPYFFLKSLMSTSNFPTNQRQS